MDPHRQGQSRTLTDIAELALDARNVERSVGLQLVTARDLQRVVEVMKRMG